MEFNTENQTVKFSYEQPSLKKYGKMKEFTLGSAGSGGSTSGNGNDFRGDFRDGTRNASIGDFKAR